MQPIPSGGLRIVVPSVWVLVSLLVGLASDAEEARSSRDIVYSRLDLCTLLEEIEPGARLPIEVSGMYSTDFENGVFYDPKQTRCRLNVEPATWVDFAPDAPRSAGFAELIEQEGRALVIFRGFLEGPKIIPPDDLSMPELIAYAQRIRGRRFGHLGGFRTRLLVTEVLSAGPAPTELGEAPVVTWKKLSFPEMLPKVEAAGLPQYPEQARDAGIQGSVLLDVWVEGGRVAAVERVAGDRLLARAAMRNVETWQLAPEVTVSIRTRFVFTLEKRTVAEGPNPKIELELPSLVKITAPSNDW